MKRAKITEEAVYGKALDRLTGADRQVQGTEKAAEIEPPAPKIKLSVFLNRQEDAYLEGLASTAKFSGGKKISKTQLVETMVRAFSSTPLDMNGVKTSDELLERLSAQLRK